MITLKYCKSSIAIAALVTISGAFAGTMDRSNYSAEKDRISADYKAEKAACDKFSANEKDICLEQAKGKEKVARAELDYKDSGKPADENRIAVAKADASFAVAKEMCDDKNGNVKDVCRAEAKAAHTKSLVDAKLGKKVGEARMDATEDKREADYKVSAEKCDSLAGDAKSACISAAKARYKKS